MLDKHDYIAQQVTYTGMIWLLAAQLVVMLPFLLYLPLWILPVMGMTTWWRLQALNGRVNQPNNIVKFVMMLCGAGALLLSGLSFPSLDAMVALLLLAFAFKMLEVVHRRDAIVVVFIGFFLTAIHFLYSQSILSGIYGVLAMVVLTSALIAVQQPTKSKHYDKSVENTVKLAGLILLQCVPLMLVIFILAPRFPPLWTVPGLSGQAKTGITDTMAPGDIAHLSRSNALAFRVTFEGERPPQNELYWRGLVLNHFNGHKWTQFDQDLTNSELRGYLRGIYSGKASQIERKGSAVEYEAIYEKTGQSWLFTLTPSIHSKEGVLQGADFRLMTLEVLQSPYLFKGISYPESIRDAKLERYLMRLALQLPSDGDMRSRQLAYKLRQEAGSDARYIEQVLERYREQEYFYTLRPPALTKQDTIDAFLLDTRRGFCAHYAGSFVFMMRAVGIPARVVIGYQGGRWNEAGQYLTVHQRDAHAWAEVWQPNKGWRRVDPTYWVAPSRIEEGLEQAVVDESSLLEGSLFSRPEFAWLEGMRQRIDSMQYGWRRWVLGYNGEAQFAFLEYLFGKLAPIKLAFILSLVIATIFIFWMFLLGMFKSSGKEALEHRLYRKYCALLAEKGIVRPIHMPANTYAHVAANALPSQAKEIYEFN